MAGFVKRFYAWTNESIVLPLGFTVGDLELTYIGQVQTRPQLTGYIEGAPPVPSENLSRPYYDSPIFYDAYNDITEVTLDQEDTRSFSVSTSDARTSQMQNISGAAGFFAAGEVSVGSPFWKDMTYTNKATLGAKFNVSHAEWDTTNASSGSGWTDVQLDKLSLSGGWEPKQTTADKYLNPETGRRYQPTNIGCALVESLVGDVFSMHLQSTGQMIGKVIVPNTDIGPDRNILNFPIDPTYTKNGTLDGKVGLVNDPDFLDADSKRGSYFKADEAYELRARIERENQNLEAHWAQFDAAAKGKSEDTNVSDFEDEQYYDWSSKTPRKSLVNNYVWTSDGASHAEEQVVKAFRTTSYSGSDSLQFLVGVSASLDLAFKVGVYGNIDALFGGEVDVSVSKSEADTNTFSIKASVNTDSLLEAWDPAKEQYGDEFCPGKVTAYRFMSFYLAPSLANSTTLQDTVIDAHWLRTSPDPNAGRASLG